MAEHKRRFSFKRSHPPTPPQPSSDAGEPAAPAPAAAEAPTYPDQFRGWLLKWTNYIKGYQKRWFVLSNGLLSYYRTQEEMAHTCRGTINLAGAFIDPIDATNFVITNGPSQVYHLRALNEVERQRWVTALELAKSRAIKNLELEDDSDSDPEETEPDNPLTGLNEKLKELATAHDLVAKNGSSLLRHIGETEDAGSGRAGSPKLKEKAALFKITASAMIKVAEEFMEEALGADRRWTRALQHERAMRLELQDNLEALANQMHGLESEARKATHQPSPQSSLVGTSVDPPSGLQAEEEGAGHGVGPGPVEPISEGSEEGSEKEEEEEQFYDATEGDDEDSPRGPQGIDHFYRGHRRDESAVSVNEARCILTSPEPEQLPVGPARTMAEPVGPVPSFFEKCPPTLEKRRSKIPAKPNHRVNLWSIMKNCIGKDLSRIPMPVNFFEPTSFLQRMVEYFIYSDILDKAAAEEDTLRQLAYITIFNAASYASTIYRVGKPFNPLLGETYECDRRAECGWRALAEQVSHHPPMYSMHVEHKEWTYWEEYTVASKFRGKYLVCYPIGTTHIVFHRNGQHYTYNRAVTTIHNIIVGRLWVDQSGELTVTNHTKGEECVLKFYPWSYFSRERQRKMRGTVKDANEVPRYLVQGYWDEYTEFAKIISGRGRDTITGPTTRGWTVIPPEPGSELMYGLTPFSASLNEMEEGIAPTDCRLRPDQRIMENGDFDGANKEKVRVEEKQRAKRKLREAAAARAAEAAATGNHELAAELEKEATYSPVWFEKDYDPLTNTMMHVYRGGYWEAKQGGHWGRPLPDIY